MEEETDGDQLLSFRTGEFYVRENPVAREANAGILVAAHAPLPTNSLLSVEFCVFPFLKIPIFTCGEATQVNG